MVNIDELKKTIRQNGETIDSLSRAIGMDDSTFYRKMKANGGAFTLAEIDEIKKALHLDRAKAEAIFFA